MAATLVSVEEYLNTSYPDGDREYVDGGIVERNVGEISHADAQLKIGSYLITHFGQLLWAGTEVRMQVRPARFRVPDVVAVLGGMPEGRVILKPPYIVVEVISPDDRIMAFEEKIRDYLDFGVPNVWVINPYTRRAHAYTAEGSHEVKDVLRASDPAIEVPLTEIFR